MAIRIDQNEMPTVEKTEEGYLRGQAIVTRTGVFIYRNEDGSERRELRHPDDILTQDSLETLKNIPVTINHPPELVNSSNTDQYMVGATGEQVQVDGQHIMTSLSIMHNPAVYEIEQNQKNNLSLGYHCDLVEEQGEFRGMPYDYRQKNVVYNHLAVVNVARAGNDARLNINKDEMSVARADQSEINEQVKIEEPEKMENENKAKINLDGTEYEVAQAVKERMEKKDADLAQLESEKEVVKARADQLQSKVDSLNAEIERLNKSVEDADNIMADQINYAAQQRIDTLTKAAKILNSDNLHEMSQRNDNEIKVEVIKKHNEHFDASDKSQEYIDARFDIICEESNKLALKRQAETIGVKTDANEDESLEKQYLKSVKKTEQMFRRNQS